VTGLGSIAEIGATAARLADAFITWRTEAMRLGFSRSSVRSLFEEAAP